MNRIACIVSVLWLSLQAAGQTFYVNGSCGNDAWSGASPVCTAPDGPKQTIQAAIPAVFTNVQIVVAPGLYLGTIVSPFNPNPPTYTLVIECEAGASAATTILDAQGADRAVDVSSSFSPATVVLRGLTIQNAEIGISCSPRMGVVLEDCIVQDCNRGFGQQGAATATNTIVQNNIDGVSPIANLDRIGGTILDRCIIRNNTRYGIRADQRTGGASIRNSLIAFNGTAGEQAVTVGLASGVTFRNSTIVGNSGPGVRCDSTGGFQATRLTAHNSVFWANNGGGDQITFNNQGGTGSFVVDVRYSTVQGGFTGDGNLNSDPLFADAGGGDFHLAAGSPAIDSGSAFLVPITVTTDLDGQPRIADDPAAANSGAPFPTYVDRGAYESGGRPYCPGDLDDDHDVELDDLAGLLAQFGMVGTGLTGDQDRSGTVDLGDLTILLSAFGQACP